MNQIYRLFPQDIDNDLLLDYLSISPIFFIHYMNCARNSFLSNVVLDPCNSALPCLSTSTGLYHSYFLVTHCLLSGGLWVTSFLPHLGADCTLPRSRP